MPQPFGVLAKIVGSVRGEATIGPGPAKISALVSRVIVIAVAVVAVVACRGPNYPAVPGDTDLHIAKVTIAARPGEQLTLDYGVLITNLGLRAKSLILPEHGWNPFRLAEDRRRIDAYLKENGRYDDEVDEPQVAWDASHTHATIAWTVHEGEAYTIGAVELRGAPPELEPKLRARIPFGPGDKIVMYDYRVLRVALANMLQDAGYGHARGYSRTFVDRAAKKVTWVYYVDPGPPTTIKSLSVEGNAHVPAQSVLERAGLVAGGKFSTQDTRRAELALLDTGAFASVNIVSDADVPHLPEFPEFGGVLAPEQVSADGELVPRRLPSEVAVRIVVVEAPQTRVRYELGIEGDPTRIDAFTGARAVLRNLFASQHHLVVEGNVGYGWIVGDDHLADGVYGAAQLQYVHSLDATDLRLTARYRDVLYPSAVLREVVAGPGLHRVLAPGVFVDGDAFLRFGQQRQFDPMNPSPDLELAADRDATGLVVDAQVIADRRDDRVEPTRGWLLGATGEYSPGGPLGDHRWLQLTGDARGFLPIGGPFSIGLRASGGWVGGANERGIPLGPRLFGGGAYGLRGFGRDRLSPRVGEVYVGARSLVESSMELRWLPYRKQVGAAAFVDLGETGTGDNPFASGIALAAGAGLRIRLWYLPVAIDVAYRILDESHAGAAWDRLLAFVRVGEAF